MPHFQPERMYGSRAGWSIRTDLSRSSRHQNEKAYFLDAFLIVFGHPGAIDSWIRFQFDKDSSPAHFRGYNMDGVFLDYLRKMPAMREEIPYPNGLLGIKKPMAQSLLALWTRITPREKQWRYSTSISASPIMRKLLAVTHSILTYRLIKASLENGFA